MIAGKTEHRPRQTQPFQEPPFQLLVDIQAKLSEGKSEGYARWAKKYNLKEMSKTLIFLQEHKIGSADELNERTGRQQKNTTSWEIPSKPPKHGWRKLLC